MFGCHVHFRMNTISEPAHPCSSHAVSTAYAKTCFMFSFAGNHPLSGSVILLFWFFYIVWYLFKLIMLIIPRCGRCCGFFLFLSFRGFFPMCLSVFIDLFLPIHLHTRVPVHEQLFFAFYCCTCFYMSCINKDLVRIDQLILLTFFQNL